MESFRLLYKIDEQWRYVSIYKNEHPEALIFYATLECAHSNNIETLPARDCTNGNEKSYLLIYKFIDKTYILFKYLNNWIKKFILYCISPNDAVCEF